MRRERTRSLDSNWIRELGEEPCAAGPPLEDGNTLGSSIERERLDQESYPFCQEEVHGDTDVLKLTICQGVESHIISGTIHKDEATEDMVRMETPRSRILNGRHDSRQDYSRRNQTAGQRILCASYGPNNKDNQERDSTRLMEDLTRQYQE